MFSKELKILYAILKKANFAGFSKKCIFFLHGDRLSQNMHSSIFSILLKYTDQKIYLAYLAMEHTGTACNTLQLF